MPITAALLTGRCDEERPPMDPASYNLDQVMQQIKNAKTAGRSD